MNEIPERVDRIAVYLREYSRPDEPSDLGALKLYKIPTDGHDREKAIGRFKNEITLLQHNRSGLIKLLDADEHKYAIVTENIPGGTLDMHTDLFKGDAYSALKAYRSIVGTVAELHHDNIVHRDIKPANVFIGEKSKLILGDLGIVYLPESIRLTTAHERVGPRDYMPQWANLGTQLEDVEPSFDVYMLGKLLWCMVDGRLFLPREYHRKANFDLEKNFPNSRLMAKINEILDNCVVEEPQHCLASARKLLDLVDDTLDEIERGLPMLDNDFKLNGLCHICGKGTYKKNKEQMILHTYNEHQQQIDSPAVQLYFCNVCHHCEIFAFGYPECLGKIKHLLPSN